MSRAHPSLTHDYSMSMKKSTTSCPSVHVNRRTSTEESWDSPIFTCTEEFWDSSPGSQR